MQLISCHRNINCNDYGGYSGCDITVHGGCPAFTTCYRNPSGPANHVLEHEPDRILAPIFRAIINSIQDEYSKCGGEERNWGPDFIALNFTAGIRNTKLGLNFGINIDRHGAIYMTNGGAMGAKSGFTGALTANYLVSSKSTPSRSQLKNFLTGSSATVTLGDGIGGTASANPQGKSIGAGLVDGFALSQDDGGEKEIYQINPNHCAETNK